MSESTSRLQSYFLCGFLYFHPLSDRQDGVVRLPGPAHLNVAEAALTEHVRVLGRRALPALRLHQHVEGVNLRHDGPSPVLKQHRLHQQDAAA